MDKHEQLYEKAKDAIEALYSDRSVDQSTTRRDLTALLEDLEIRIETLTEN